MRSTAIALVVALFTITSGNAFALPIDLAAAEVGQEAPAWRKVAAAIPLGSRVKLQTVEGKRLTGTLMHVDDTAVTLKRNTRLPAPGVSVTYQQIANMERDHGGGMNWAKAVGIGVGAGAGAILTILVIALQLD